MPDDASDGGQGKCSGGEEHLHLALAETIGCGLNFDPGHMDPPIWYVDLQKQDQNHYLRSIYLANAHKYLGEWGWDGESRVTEEF